MVGLRNAFMKLDSPRAVFYPGQVILGSVVIELDQPLTFSVLYVNFLGEAVVGWTEKESAEYNGVTKYKMVEYAGREEYFNVTQLLAGGNALPSPLNLNPGTYTYQFSYQIPPGVPSSFSGKRGGVKYRVKANVEFGGNAVFKQDMVKDFEVVAPFDLNNGVPQLKEPIDLEFEEVYNCGCFCSSDPVTIRIRLPVSGYCPGQVIPVAVDVENQSSVEISRLEFEILRRVKYHSQRPVSEYIPPEKVLTTEKRGGIMSGTKRFFTVDLAVPELIAPNLENCGIIDVGYFFRAKIKLTGCNDNLEDEAEICLGLVPLKETLNGEYVHPLSHSLPIGPIPDIPEPNLEEENRQFEAQQSAHPNGAQYPHAQNFQPGFPNASPFSSNENVQSSFVLNVQQQSYSSTDPSRNYNIGFTTTSPQEFKLGFDSMMTDLKVHMPMSNVNVKIPTAPPESPSY